MSKQSDNINQAWLLALNEISIKLRNAGDLTERAVDAIDYLIGFGKMERGLVLLTDEDREHFYVLAARNNREESIPGQIDPAGKQLILQCLNTNQMLLRDEQLSEDSDEIVSQVAVPLSSENRLLGLLFLEQRQQEPFEAAFLECLGVISGQFAQAIAIDRLKAAVQREIDTRSEYTSLVTHQLRVPLTSIGGYTDMIAAELVGPLTDKQQEFLGTIQRNVGRMSELIRTLGEINRIDSGRKRYKMTRIDLNDLLIEVTSQLEESFSDRDQHLVLTVEPDIPDVFADRDAVSRVLTHLLKNASHYSEDDTEIRLTARQISEQVEIQVADDGFGITGTDQDQLFTLFFRAESEAVRQQFGWGLGLALSKRLVEDQGGQIAFQSKIDQGSEFSFTLQIADYAKNPT